MRVLLLTLMSLLLVLPAFAQDAETTAEPPLTAGLWTYAPGGELQSDCYGSSSTFDPYGDYDPEALPSFALIPADNGEWLLIQAGADYRFTPADEGSFNASLIDSQDLFTFEGTMEFTSPDAFTVVGEFAYDPSCTYTGTTQFELVEAAEVSIWTEMTREFSDITFFNECLDRDNTVPAPGWAASDLLALLTETETGLMLDGVVFDGAPGEYIYEDRDETTMGVYYDIITLTGAPEDGLLTVNHFYQIDDRADCQVEYDSEYVPFDGDVDALVSRIVNID